MVNLLLSLSLGLIGGLISGWLVARRNRRRLRRRLPDAGLSPELDRQIDDAARQWANAQGKPAIAPLLAGKLRLMHRVQQRRGWSRW
jgi:hypothetical protein